MWRKFNDLKVDTGIEEREVLEMANGGSGQKTAFWVVYLNKDELKTAQQSVLYHMKQNSYASLLSPQQRLSVNDANKKFDEAYTNRLDDILLAKVNEKYLAYLNELQDAFQGTTDKAGKERLQNASTYCNLWANQKQDLCKRLILKQAFDQVFEKDKCDNIQVV